jgi:hypothetical protein
MNITNAEIYIALDIVQEYDPPFVDFYNKDRSHYLGHVHTDSFYPLTTADANYIFNYAAYHGVLHDYEADIKRIKTLMSKVSPEMKAKILEALNDG